MTLFYVVTWIVLEKVCLVVVAVGNRIEITKLEASKSWSKINFQQIISIAQ